jgi:hypothetical protein
MFDTALQDTFILRDVLVNKLFSGKWDYKLIK